MSINDDVDREVKTAKKRIKNTESTINYAKNRIENMPPGVPLEIGTKALYCIIEAAKASYNSTRKAVAPFIDNSIIEGSCGNLGDSYFQFRLACLGLQKKMYENTDMQAYKK